MLKKNDRFNRILFFLSFFFVVLGHRFYFLSGDRAVPAYYLALAVVFFILARRYWKLVVMYAPGPFVLLLATLCFYALISSIAFSRPQDVAQFEIFLFLPMVFFVFGAVVQVSTVAVAINSSLVLSALLSVAQIAYTGFNISGPLGLFALIKEQEYLLQDEVLRRTVSLRATGLFVEPNIFGFYSGLCFFWFLQAKKYLKSRVFIIGLYLSVFCVVASMSRGSIVALFLTLLLKFFGEVPRFRIGASGLFTLVLVAFAFYGLLQLSEIEQFSRIGEILGVVSKGGGESENLDARYSAWESLMQLVYTNPFGLIQPPQMVVEDSPDNQYLYFALQGGVPLFGVLLFFCVSTGFASFRALLSNKSNFFYCLSFFVINNFTITAMNSFGVFVFWLAFGLFVAQRRQAKFCDAE